MTKKKANKPVLMTGAEFAKHRGVTPQRISALKKRGVLVMSGGLVDRGASDAQLDAETNPSGAETLSEAQRRKESSLADLRALELEMKSGKLVEVQAVKKLWFEKSRGIRDAILTIPERISHALAAESDPKTVRALLRAELVAKLEKIADATLSK